MATVRELKAAARPKSGKGAARAERRAGRVPAVIYGDNQPPLGVSFDNAEIRQRIYAGRFLTTIFDIDLDGKKHRVIPRDFQLDPVKDTPVHVDFMRLGEGATIRVNIPVHVRGAEVSPGVKRGGAVNIVLHTIAIRVRADQIPESFDIDVSDLEINHSRHLGEINFPEGIEVLEEEGATLVTIVPPSGYAEDVKAVADAAAAAAAAAAAPAAAAGAKGGDAKAGDAKAGDAKAAPAKAAPAKK
jgi:large subunit ribosomal protein L25